MLCTPMLYQGYALHYGINQVDPAAYGGPQTLYGCHNDARAMRDISLSLGYEATLRLDKEVTIKQVKADLKAVAKQMFPADVALITYSGHGSQVPDINHDEPDHMDEAWCLYDGMLLDDELYGYLGMFPERSRIVIVSDSCHSGTMIREPFMDRGLSRPAAKKAYRIRQDYYDAIPRAGKEKYALEASVCLLSGCQDNQYSGDGEDYGLFTGTLLRVWNDGAFVGDYWKFHQEILKRMPADQSPNLMFVGYKNLQFEWSTPFVVR